VVFRELDGFAASAAFWLSWYPSAIPPAAERLRQKIMEE
jgi:hypothetical protein